MIPSFRTVADAAAYAEQHQPLRASLQYFSDDGYSRRYGLQAHNAANICRIAAIKGDMHRLHLGCMALSLSVNPPTPRRIAA